MGYTCPILAVAANMGWVNEPIDSQLLRAYAEQCSEEAFSELVSRHVDLVYSASLRMVRDRHLAEDVTQAAFVALARNAPQLVHRSVLSGWLHRTAQNIAVQTVRSIERRRAREQEASAMNEVLDHESDATWKCIAPHLDDALGTLNESDRDALMLRYFERKSAQEMAQILGISSEAAQKRVTRAVDRLREYFAQCGITAGTSGGLLATLTNAVQAAPIGLAATISKAAPLAAVATTSTSGISLIQSLLMTTTKKVLTAAALATAVGTGIYKAHQLAALRNRVSMLQQQAALIDQTNSDQDKANKESATDLLHLPGALAEPRKNIDQDSLVHSRSNLLNALLSPGGEIPAVSSDFLERWFASGRTNALDLLAARRASQNADFFHQALTIFPNDPRVLLAGDQFNGASEAQRKRLDRLKTADPDNALVDYLSAKNYLKEGRIEEALVELSAASGKERFDDYSRDSTLAVEELYLAAGFSPAEAKAYGTSQTPLPHLSSLKGLSQELAKLQQNYLAAGNQEGAEDLARLGMQLGQRLRSSTGARCIVEELTGMSIEAQVLNPLPPEGHYNFVPGGIPEYLDQISRRRADLKGFWHDCESWLRQASDSEIVAYFDRVKMFGEVEALKWVEARRGQP